MRKLASAQYIIDLQPIEGADRIEQCQVLGWNCVVPKGKFKIGELVAYLEIDSVLSDELLKSQGLWDEAKGKGLLGKKAGNVLTTRKFKGTLAQGLVIQLNKETGIGFIFKEGDDLTQILKITKYERYVEVEDDGVPGVKRPKWKRELLRSLKPAIFFLSRYFPFLDKYIGAGGPFPGFIKKTDQTRIQNLTSNWKRLSEYDYEVTEKMEGTSSTYFYYKGDYGICSRNLRISNNATNHFGIVQKKYDIFTKLKKHKMNIAIQGEIVGPSIQGNYYGLPEHELKIFDIYLIDEQRYALPFERMGLVKKLGFDHYAHAPILPVWDVKGKTIPEVLEMADAKSTLGENVDREGIVLKSLKSDISFKAISNSYLLKQK